MKQAICIKAQHWLDVVFPPRCGSCGALTGSHGRLCADCWSKITFLHRPWCAACGYPFPYDLAEENALCIACMQHKPAFDGHRALLCYDEHSKKLVHNLKYHDKPLLLPLFGEWLMQAGSEWMDAEQKLLIIPVPLHFLRLLKRRYNQAGLLAQALAKRSGIPLLPDGLKRVRRRPPQAGLSREKRLKNMRGAFAVNAKRRDSIKGATILLVDDVMTTGATLNACARTLKRAGAEKVYAVTIARTVLEH